jgi:HEAT repeat protein
VRIGAAARTLAQAAAWRAGSRAAGRALVRTLATDDETVRMLAGMSLVQSGPRAAPLVRECVRAREGLPDSLTVLADVGGPEDAALVRAFVDDPDPDVRTAAGYALESLAFRLASPRTANP